eukprot:3223829-Prymnesium_polylepis.1
MAGGVLAEEGGGGDDDDDDNDDYDLAWAAGGGSGGGGANGGGGGVAARGEWRSFPRALCGAEPVHRVHVKCLAEYMRGLSADGSAGAVSYTHLRAHETLMNL